MADFRKHAEVVYQIFPDRFRNGNPAITPRPGAWKWHGQPIGISTDPTRLTAMKTHQKTYFGGDFEGIEQSIPHLKSLGVTLVYLNPIFAARTSHRYDTIDYTKPDAALGSRADFDRMVDAMHANGIKVFLDGVFNHTGIDHPWHVDPVMRKRMYVMRDDEHAMGWMGGSGLPKLDTQNGEVQQAILEILDGWHNVDGWRLDAAHLLPQAFLKRLTDHVAPKPVLVEDWNFAQHYFTNELAHGVTNFPFREAMKCYFVEDCSPETLLARLRMWIDLYPEVNHPYCWNYLDNHDLGRFRDDVQSRERLLRALVFKFTLPGSPLLFQGIEIGLEGEDAERSRIPMPWDDESSWDQEVLATTRALSALRHEYQVLVEGSFEGVFADNRSRTLAFARRTVVGGDSHSAIIAINDGYQACIFDAGFGSWSLEPGEWRIEIRINQECVAELGSGNLLTANTSQGN